MTHHEYEYVPPSIAVGNLTNWSPFEGVSASADFDEEARNGDAVAAPANGDDVMSKCAHPDGDVACSAFESPDFEHCECATDCLDLDVLSACTAGKVASHMVLDGRRVRLLRDRL